jgi:preprotein translocase subunit SecA
MFDYLEESLYSTFFYRNGIPAESFAAAARILDNAYQLCGRLRSNGELGTLYESINPADTGTDEYAAALAVAACRRSCGTVWKIHGSNYLWNIVPRVPQIAAGLQLCSGDRTQFALQRTGEGKTISALIAIALLAVRGTVHVVTANEYLASRDCQWIGPILELLGITCSFLERESTAKRKCYSARVVFGSDKEFLFDFLRDSIRPPEMAPFCRKRDTVLVDEGDHILLDELMTPAIISKEHHTVNTFLLRADTSIRSLIRLQEGYCKSQIARLTNNAADDCSPQRLITVTALRHSGRISEVSEFLKKNRTVVVASERYEFKRFMRGDDSGWYTKDLYFEVNPEEKSCSFTDRGMEYLEKEFGYAIFTLTEGTADGEYDALHYTLLTALQNALEAHVVLQRDSEYIVKDSAIEVITSSIGRADRQKRFGHGLAGAVAVKEGITYRNDSRVVTRTTILSLIREYAHGAVLSGTLLPDHREFEKLYNAKTFPVPTYQPIIARHRTGNIYTDETSKFNALLKEVLAVHKMGRPVLIGTNSIITSEKIACILETHGVPARILNAKNENEEARIITNAGAYGAVTVATNMAGRGCDIVVTKETENRIGDTFVNKALALRKTCTVIELECSSRYESERLQAILSGSGVQYGLCRKKGPLWLVRIKGTGVRGETRLIFGLGLHVVIAECCSSRRIETQLRGRTGRQGNPGSSSLFMSFDDEALLPVSSLRWFGTRISRRVDLNGTRLIKRFLLLMIYFATESDMRFKRGERAFYDGVSELIRKRFVAMRERALRSGDRELIRFCIRSYMDYLNEEARFIRNYETRTSMISSRLQVMLGIDASQLPKTIVNEQGGIDSKIEKWVAGLLVLKGVTLSGKSIISMYCSCIDEIWSTFSASLESYQEQAGFRAFAGRDPKESYIDITFSQWHESVYRLHECFLRNLFQQQLPSSETLKISTNSTNNVIEKLIAL